MTGIRLYLGAHKTATTHLQGVLMANRHKLAELGGHLSAPQDVRKEWLPLYFQAVRALGETGKIPPRLRSPLGALSSCVQLLGRVVDGRPNERALRIARQSIASISEMITARLFFTR